jgi:hypothetical protein
VSKAKKPSTRKTSVTKKIQKRTPVKAVPAKGLEDESEGEDLDLENEVDEENALAELELQEGHIQGVNEEEDQVPSPASPSPIPLLFQYFLQTSTLCSVNTRHFSMDLNQIPRPPRQNHNSISPPSQQTAPKSSPKRPPKPPPPCNSPRPPSPGQST